MTTPTLWSSAESYERYMGRWSRRVAPLFLDWLDAPPQGAWVDIGCGTGGLSAAVLATADPARTLGIDSAAAFLEAARAAITDPRASFSAGDALALPAADQDFDVAVSGLVLNFVSDKLAMLREMGRVVRPGGTVGLYVWDYAGHMQVMRHFFDAATEFDPGAQDYDDGVRAPVCRPGPLRQILEDAGLEEVEVQAIDIAAAFESFEDYWMPFLGGTGSAPRYCATMSDSAREQLRERLRSRLPTGPDGEILLAVRAWAARGTVSA